MTIIRKAGAVWEGDLRSGKGLISTESQALYEQPYSFKTRFQNEPGTNPEELIAAAHAACFSMAFANTLKKEGYSPERVDTNAECIQVPDIDAVTFEKIAKQADRGCPVSNLLRPGLEIEHDFELV